MIEPNEVADSDQYHIFVHFASEHHRWALRLHDMLTHCRFNVLMRQYASSPLEPTIALMLDRPATKDVVAQCHKRVLIWPPTFDGLTPGAIATLAEEVTAANFDCTVAIGNAEIPDALQRTAPPITLDEFVPDDWDEAVPTWQDVVLILKALDAATLTDDVKSAAIARDLEFLSAVKEIGNKSNDAEGLYRLAESKADVWLNTPHLGCQVCERLVKLKRTYEALRHLNVFYDRFKGSVRVSQLQALAHRRSLNPERAQAILHNLYDDGWRDPETLGILGATWMERYVISKNTDHLQKSANHYTEGFDETPTDTYVGINAAAKSAFLRDRKKAEELAARVEAILSTPKEREKIENDYWKSATLAEVYLLQRKYSEAAKQYHWAVTNPKFEMDIGSHETTWLQAQRILEAFQPSESTKAEFADVFPGMGPPLELAQEVRLAVVMFGGVSLAIYINGVTKELLNLVRATAPVKGTQQSALPFNSLKSTDQVYRKLAHRLCADRGATTEVVVDTTSPIQTRFVIDILSGTSAGGINSICLAKALAYDRTIDDIKQLWIKEADIDVLVNDRHARPGRLRDEIMPKSLLDSQYLYDQLLSALNDMDAQPVGKLQCATEVDLYITTTDLHGLDFNVPLADQVVTEKRYKNVFHFRHAEGTIDPRQDFDNENNPFLAFAARCTSAFPFAFEPMTLESTGKDNEAWQRFYEDYLNYHPQTGQVVSKNDFAARPFGDGGYLDNKPFSYAIRQLQNRRAILPVQRKLVYIEPKPTGNDTADSEIREISVVENVMAALVSLPRYETIREDLEEVTRRNRIVEQVVRTTNALEQDVAVAQKSFTNIRAEEITNTFGNRWAKLDLDEMIARKGAAYGGYHRLKVENLIDDLAAIIATAAGFRLETSAGQAVRVLVDLWCERNFVENSTATSDLPTQNKFLVDFDLSYRIRRLRFVLAKVEQLRHLDDEALQALRIERNKISKESQQRELKHAIVAMKPRLAQILDDLYALQYRLHVRSTKPSDASGAPVNPLRSKFAQLKMSRPDYASRLTSIGEKSTPDAQRDEAEKLSDDFKDDIERIAADLASVLREPMVRAASECAAALDPKGLEQELSPLELAARKCLWEYYRYFEDYDMVTYPVLSHTGVGEAATIEILRFSPLDVADKDGLKKLAGTQLANFGGFLKESWRRNDIFWGRMHAAERLLTTFLGERHPQCQMLLDEARSIIIREEFEKTGQEDIAGLALHVVQNASDEDLGNEKRKEMARRLGEAPWGNVPVDQDGLRKYFVNEHDVDRSLDAKKTVPLVGRCTQVVGKMLQDLAEGNSAASRFAVWSTRLGQAVTGLVAVAIPGNLAHYLYIYWRGLLYLFALTLFVAGSVFMNTPIQKFAIQIALFTALFGLAVRLTRDFLNEWKVKDFVPRAKLITRWLLFGLVLALAGIGASTVWNSLPGSQVSVLSRLCLVAAGAAAYGLSWWICWLALGRWNWLKRKGSRAVWATLLGIGPFAILVCLAGILNGEPWSSILSLRFLIDWWYESPY